MRKFWLTLAGLTSFTLILMFNSNLDPMALGIAEAMLLTPMAAANAMEHKFKNNK